MYWPPDDTGVKGFENGCAPGFSHVYSFQFQSRQHVGSLIPLVVINLRSPLLLGIIGNLVGILLILRTMECQLSILPHAPLGTRIRS